MGGLEGHVAPRWRQRKRRLLPCRRSPSSLSLSLSPSLFRGGGVTGSSACSSLFRGGGSPARVRVHLGAARRPPRRALQAAVVGLSLQSHFERLSQPLLVQTPPPVDLVETAKSLTLPSSLSTLREAKLTWSRPASTPHSLRAAQPGSPRLALLSQSGSARLPSSSPPGRRVEAACPRGRAFHCPYRRGPADLVEAGRSNSLVSTASRART